MSCAGHCPTCSGHLGFCSDHTTGATPCRCPPVGWTCPVCGLGIAPGVKTCNHGERSDPLVVVSNLGGPA